MARNWDAGNLLWKEIVKEVTKRPIQFFGFSTICLIILLFMSLLSWKFTWPTNSKGERIGLPRGTIRRLF